MRPIPGAPEGSTEHLCIPEPRPQSDAPIRRRRKYTPEPPPIIIARRRRTEAAPPIPEYIKPEGDYRTTKKAITTKVIRDRDVDRDVMFEAVKYIIDDTRAGRPTVYRHEFAELLYQLRIASVPFQNIARIFRVDTETLQAWLDFRPKFSASWINGGDLADAKVGMALYSRATGFTRINKKIQRDKLTGQEYELEEEVYYPPDMHAISFWLSNRKSAHWTGFRQGNRQPPIESPDPALVALQPPRLVVNFIPDKSQPERPLERQDLA